MFSYISSYLENPKAMLMFLLLALPGRVMALCAHEYAHAYIADRCGDPTARMLGRLTLNPAKHLDIMGTIMMLLLGFGWAKPVPINPRNYNNPRRDDIKVSLAGIVMNLILFLLGYIALSAFLTVALRSLPAAGGALLSDAEMFVTDYNGQRVMISGNYYYTIADMFRNAPYIAETVIEPIMGRLPSYIYQMLSYFTIVNISLAVFNILPIPPLDGYHVLNDTLLRRSMFAAQRTARIAMGALFVASMTGLLGKVLSYAVSGVMSGMGSTIGALFALLI